MAPSGLFYLWIFLSYTIGILGSLCILLRSYMCSQHSIFSQSWLIMIGKDIFQNENGIFIRILTSSLLISVDIKYGRDLSDDHPNNARCFNLYRWQSLLFRSHVDSKFYILPFGMEELIYRKTEENKNIIKTVKEKIYEKSNARKIRS